MNYFVVLSHSPNRGHSYEWSMNFPSCLIFEISTILCQNGHFQTFWRQDGTIMSRYLFCCCHIVFSSPRAFIWVVGRLPTMFNFRDILYLRLRAKNAHFQTFWRQNGAIMSRYGFFRCFITIYSSKPFVWVVDQLPIMSNFRDIYDFMPKWPFSDVLAPKWSHNV